MTEPHWTDALARFSPCADAMTYLRTQPDAETAWAQCERGDWMLWLASKCAGAPESEGRKALVLAACACARLALPRFTKRYPNDGWVLACIETAERWARGEATIAELRIARTDAAAAAYAYAAAAYAATHAAAAAAAAARKKALAECADLVRLTYPVPAELSRYRAAAPAQGTGEATIVTDRYFKYGPMHTASSWAHRPEATIDNFVEMLAALNARGEA